MITKKRHHYIPRFYLDGFIDPHNKPYIWIYEKGNEKIIKAKSKDIAVEKHYFSYRTPNGSRDSNTLENGLAKIEGNTASVFKKIREERSLSAEDKKNFAIFLAFIMTRVPNFRQNIVNSMGEGIKKIYIGLASNQKGFEGGIKSFEKDTGKKIEMPVEKLRKWIINGKYEVKVNPQFGLGIAMSLAVELANIFLKMKWIFIKATDEHKFLTGDNPIFYCDLTHNPDSFYGVGLLNENVEITFPINRDLALTALWKGRDEHIQGNNKMVKEINRRTVESALRFVFSSQKLDALNRLVQKYINSAPVMEVR